MVSTAVGDAVVVETWRRRVCLIEEWFRMLRRRAGGRRRKSIDLQADSRWDTSRCEVESVRFPEVAALAFHTGSNGARALHPSCTITLEDLTRMYARCSRGHHDGDDGL